MLKITIENLNQQEIFSQEKNHKVIDLIHESYIDWMHACGKKGKCTTCKMIVLKGMQNLSPLTESEEIFRQNGRLKMNERLTCQAFLISGELVIRIDEANKFPHMNYSG